VIGVIAALLVIDAAALLLTRGGDGNTTPIPDVAGRTSAEAVATLRGAGFTPRTDGRVDATVARGIVISTSPPAGEKAEDGSEVTVTVSQGTGSAAVPALAGLTRDAATAALDAAGLEGRYLQAASASVPEGSVVSQDPAAGLQIPVGSVVAVTLSTGPPMVDVPDLVGGTVEDASVALRSAGLTLGVVRQAPAGGSSPGTVVAQAPAAGDEAVEGSAVDVTVAQAGTGTSGG
jgi:serine/threonine-protein kinase